MVAGREAHVWRVRRVQRGVQCVLRGGAAGAGAGRRVLGGRPTIIKLDLLVERQPALFFLCPPAPAYSPRGWRVQRGVQCVLRGCAVRWRGLRLKLKIRRKRSRVKTRLLFIFC